MYYLYQIVTGLLFWLAFPVALLLVWSTGRHRRGLGERFGLYRLARPAPGTSRVWIHAASVGEIRAAQILISHLAGSGVPLCFAVTTMTIHGRDYARGVLPADIPCFLAPLDVPFVVDRVLNQMRATTYVCLETELWPLLIQKAQRRGMTAVLLNGRISDKSIDSYRRLRCLFGPVITSFSRVAAISAIDRDRFVQLGADPEGVSVTGNIKHELKLPEDRAAIAGHYRDLLLIDEKTDVFIAGSTHPNEEELLLPVYRRLAAEQKQIWLIAPRHLSRLPAIEAMLARQEVGYHRLSGIRQTARRRHNLVLIDSMGELAELYAIAAFVFIGGSLTDHGGHNVMEAAIWDKAVFFGPYMQDFKEAAEALEQAGAGWRVSTAADLEQRLLWCLTNRQAYEEACRRAGKIAGAQHGIARAQAELVLRSLGCAAAISASGPVSDAVSEDQIAADTADQ